MTRIVVKYLVVAFLIAGGCIADAWTKSWAEKNLKDKPSISLVNGVLSLGFAENRGMVFGVLNNRMPRAARGALVAMRVMILIILTVYLVINRRRSFFFHLPFLLLLAGALGNLIDPFVYGYVVDFIYLHLGDLLSWPFFFNLADAYVTVGIVILLLNGSLWARPADARESPVP